ncbi:MAG TPA: hypothetical protein PKO15_05545 [Fibrobacteria bacterium]|nr:hypothetical protein [Fibrobacteria bacterium]HOX51937.1 hypothetical protein [Fibrobacteria bacterium]
MVQVDVSTPECVWVVVVPSSVMEQVVVYSKRHFPEELLHLPVREQTSFWVTAPFHHSMKCSFPVVEPSPLSTIWVVSAYNDADPESRILSHQVPTRDASWVASPEVDPLLPVDPLDVELEPLVLFESDFEVFELSSGDKLSHPDSTARQSGSRNSDLFMR